MRSQKGLCRGKQPELLGIASIDGIADIERKGADAVLAQK